MSCYTITKISGTPDWEQLPALKLENRLWTPPCPISAEAKLCWDEENLYVRMSAAEAQIRAEHTEPLASVCEDSCLEFFFCPVSGDRRYINIEFNPNGCVFFGVGYGRADRLRLITRRDLFEPCCEGVKGGWQVTYRVPFRLIATLFPAFSPRTGDTMAANFYKCGDLTPQPHYFSWSNITLAQPDFHCSEFFGQLVFG